MTHPLDKIQEIRRRYLLVLGLLSSQCDPQQMHRDIGTLLAEVERLREALAWYGWRGRESSGSDPFAACSALMNDQGERARKALEGGR